ncbi:MAG TPA: ATP-binding protein [Anaeromyxobacteraceae bacterium]|nr:ATP-binding protein [Anaeromyxobacteraceae bacterium]
MAVFRDPIAAAIRELEAELSGGPRADLSPSVETLGALLLEREARLRALEREQPERELLAAVPDAAGLISRQGMVRSANAALESLAPGGRAVGLTLLELTRSGELSDAARRALEGNAKRLEVQLGRRSFLAHLVPLVRGEVLVLLRDVTEQRLVDSTRRDFVANASHELRTPVTAISGAAETLLSGAVNDPVRARHFLDIIARNADRLAHLTRDLLDLSRVESRQWVIALEPVPVGAATRSAVEACADAASRKRIEVRVEVPEEAAVRADVRALEHVLLNLLDNAVKFTPDGGTVTVSAEVAADVVTLSVADTGPGIERHHLPRLFERFYRVDPGRSRDSGGTGLGLAIVKHLVQAQGGEVGVESGSGGTRFWVKLAHAAGNRAAASPGETVTHS